MLLFVVVVLFNVTRLYLQAMDATSIDALLNIVILEGNLCARGVMV